MRCEHNRTSAGRERVHPIASALLEGEGKCRGHGDGRKGRGVANNDHPRSTRATRAAAAPSVCNADIVCVCACVVSLSPTSQAASIPAGPCSEVARVTAAACIVCRNSRYVERFAYAANRTERRVVPVAARAPCTSASASIRLRITRNATRVSKSTVGPHSDAIVGRGRLRREPSCIARIPRPSAAASCLTDSLTVVVFP